MITQNDAYFIFSLICLGFCAFFLPLTLYLLPSAWLGWVYHLPNSVYAIQDWLQTVFNTDDITASWIVIGSCFMLFLWFGWLTYYFSLKAKEGLRRVSSALSGDEQALRSYNEKQESRETVLLVIKMLFILGLVFVVASLMHYAISLAPVT